MNAALWGFLSSAGLGTADFMGRFSARAVGAPLAYGVVLLVGALGATACVLFSEVPLVWSARGCAFAAAHGVSVAVMCVLLYEGLARGPVAIVAPIVAAHPAFVLAINVGMGVRPTLAQSCAMAGIILGGLLIARNAVSHPQFISEGRSTLSNTLRIAWGACFAYVLLILTGQAAVPLLGEFQTVWIARWAGLAAVALVLLVQRTKVAVPCSWLPFLAIQGTLDGLGYVAFLAGASTAAPHISMVVASTFSMFTIILARVVLDEPISFGQWVSIGIIATGTAVLASGI